MVAALQVRQGSLVKVLQSLLASEVITVERRFVGDAYRHMKVYRLTSLGESTARNVRRRTSQDGRPPPENGWIV